MESTNLHIAWAQLLIRSLLSAGVHNVVLSPGSRSTPLALAVASEKSINLHVIVDERTAAFFALGQARVTGQPTVLICTSGTAAAHYYPALIEASQIFIPLIVITADRPWELQDISSPQTIDQRKMFGAYVRHYAELGLPDPSISALRAVVRVASQAVNFSLGPKPGPVHINASFRKPLEPVDINFEEPWVDDWSLLMKKGAPKIFSPKHNIDTKTIAALKEQMMQAQRGLIVCGPAPFQCGQDNESIFELARMTGFPVLAEATSQMKFGKIPDDIVLCSFFNIFLQAAGSLVEFKPDLIIEIYQSPVSSAYETFRSLHSDCPRIVITPYGWNDSTNYASAIVFCSPGEVCAALCQEMSDKTIHEPWKQMYAIAEDFAHSSIQEVIESYVFCEGAIAYETLLSAPEESILMIGNSCPVRDIDDYCSASEKKVHILHQRGASGIDGLIAGTMGTRSITNQPVGLLLGDVSLLHDLSSLHLASKAHKPVVIVMVQNGGGRIFDRLPLAQLKTLKIGQEDLDVDDVVEKYFATPEYIDMRHITAGLNIDYVRASTQSELRKALQDAWASSTTTLIEAVVPPKQNTVLLKEIVQKVSCQLREHFH